jgi:hypothetical protein
MMSKTFKMLLIGNRMLDHIIIGDGSYFSFSLQSFPLSSLRIVCMQGEA